MLGILGGLTGGMGGLGGRIGRGVLGVTGHAIGNLGRGILGPQFGNFGSNKNASGIQGTGLLKGMGGRHLGGLLGLYGVSRMLRR